ncbi:MAG: peptidylprolyl isomerase [Thermomicrobiales bacterium]|nr:peptidylprolyl isomerase [Thermomicrobiales bacterium]
MAQVGPPPRKRRVPRREIEARRQRMLRWGVGIAAVVTVAILAFGFLYDNVIKPNQTLARVGPAAISRQDYWKSRAYDLFEQAQQYQDFAQFVGPEQQNQYLAMAQQSLSQVPQIWGSTDVDATSLQKMIDNQVYLQGLGDLGVSMTPEEVHTFALNRFAPPDTPLIPAAPTPTLIPERSAMATGTAQALFGTPVASPVAATPGAAPPIAGSEQGTPLATPAAGGATPVATPDPAEARATAEAGFDRFATTLFPAAHLSQQDYERLIAAPALARKKVSDALTAQIGQSAPQVRAAHILAPTQEAAEAARQRILAGDDFATVAREVSTDSATAGNGGELGWFTHEEMAPAFADAAFSLAPGEISEPVQTQYGWHLIEVEEKDPDRPMTEAQINRVKQATVDQWLQDETAKLAISSSLPPTPTPFAQTFQPPVDAPPPPTPTPSPPATPGAAPANGAIPGTPSG